MTTSSPQDQARVAESGVQGDRSIPAEECAEARLGRPSLHHGRAGGRRDHRPAEHAGANVDVKPEWLAEFALMGSIYAQLALGVSSPSVATLSNGEEEGKGNAVLNEAIPLLRALPIRYIGNIEGNEVMAGGR